MIDALDAWLQVARAGGSRAEAVRGAANAVATDPWRVVEEAGPLARCRMVRYDKVVGLTAAGRVVSEASRHAVLRISAGDPVPVSDVRGKRALGAFDTSRDLARRTCAAAMASARGDVDVGLDPSCGTGAFLVALQEVGVGRILGSDLDPVALEVARIAAPDAEVTCADAWSDGGLADVVVGNPPYVPPERQAKDQRQMLRDRYRWLRGRFDLAIPFAERAVERCRHGGGVSLVLPTSVLVQPYGESLRRRWLERHAFTMLDGPEKFPGASVDVVVLGVTVGGPPTALPPHGVPVSEVLALPQAPLRFDARPGDAQLLARVREASVALDTLCRVDTGVVAHGPLGGKERLLFDEPGPGRVPFADASDFFSGRRRWLAYRPNEMHRPKFPALFENPKLVVQRIRGSGPIRVAVDRTGVYVGHTCTVVQPIRAAPPLERLAELLRSTLVDGLIKIQRGTRLDFYPHDVGGVSVPRRWLQDHNTDLVRAWSLTESDVARLETLASR